MTYLEFLETVVDAVKDYAPSAAITHYKKGHIPTEDEMHMIRELNHKYANKENSSELLVESLVVEMHEQSYITLNLESLYEKNPTADEIREVVKDRIDMFSKLQRYMAGTAIVKAWVFGSFARGEEKKDSDLDILVDYDPSANLSLLGAIRYKLDMEKLIGREVDLVENGYLKPFAIPSCERDKYLIYER